jgi:hypothetical protein
MSADDDARVEKELLALLPGDVLFVSPRNAPIVTGIHGKLRVTHRAMRDVKIMNVQLLGGTDYIKDLKPKRLLLTHAAELYMCNEMPGPVRTWFMAYKLYLEKHDRWIYKDGKLDATGARLCLDEAQEITGIPWDKYVASVKS